MLTTVDLANQAGPILAYWIFAEGDVAGTVTLFLKLGPEESEDSSCIKVRFTRHQFHALRGAFSAPLDFPGIDINAAPPPLFPWEPGEKQMHDPSTI